MRFLLSIGRLRIFDFSLFQIDSPSDNPDVVVVHKYTDEEDEDQGPGDFFGGKGH